MLRGLTVVVLIVGLVALLVLGPRYLRSTGEAGKAPSAGASDVCNLDEGACQWRNEAGEWQMALSRSGKTTPPTLTLSLSAPESVASSERLMAVLSGYSMEMGTFPVVLTPTGEPGQFRGQGQAPVCSVDTEMTWQVALRQGGSDVAMPEVVVFHNVVSAK